MLYHHIGPSVHPKAACLMLYRNRGRTFPQSTPTFKLCCGDAAEGCVSADVAQLDGLWNSSEQRLSSSVTYIITIVISL